MAAPTIPPIRVGLTGTGLAVEKLHRPALCRLADRYVVTAFTDRSGEQSRRFADYSGAGPARATADRAALLAGSSSERRVTRSSSDTTTHTTVFPGIDDGHRAEFVDLADAVRFGVRPVGSAAPIMANVQRTLDSAERAAVLALDPVPGQHISSSASFAA